MSFDDRPRALTSLTTYLLSQVAKVAKEELDDRLAEQGMRLRHMAVLAAVHDAPLAQHELAHRLSMDPSDVTATVDDLAAKGFVARKVDVADRRRRRVTPTARGRRELDRLGTVAEGIADHLLAPIPERRRRQLHADLRRVLVASDATRGI